MGTHNPAFIWCQADVHPKKEVPRKRKDWEAEKMNEYSEIYGDD